MDPDIVLVGLVVALLAAVVALVAVVRRDRRRRPAPLLVAVADYSTGVLACPTCRGTSFQSPPAGERAFFGFFLFFFLFGNLSSTGTQYAECVACTRVFRRGGLAQRVSEDRAGDVAVT